MTLSVDTAGIAGIIAQIFHREKIPPARGATGYVIQLLEVA
jgi:hypothetical protein